MSYNKTTKMFEGYIYIITNLINNKIYIGQTVCTIKERWRHHVKPGYSNRKTVIDRAIKKYGQDNFTIKELLKIEDCDKKILQDRLNILEREYIDKYKSLEKYGGYNIDIGGSAGTCNNMSVDVYNMKGELLTTYESRKQAGEDLNICDNIIIDICYGKKANFKCQFVFRNHGDAFDKYDITKHIDYRDVYKYTLDGELVGRYYSYGEIPDKCSTWVHDIIGNPHKTAGGYWWNDKPIFNYKGSIYNNSVDLYDKDGNFISNFSTVDECADYLGCSKKNIRNCCNGKTKSVNKMVTRYSGDSFDKFDMSYKGGKKVNQYSLDNMFIKTYESLHDASIAVSKSVSSICGVCRGYSKTANGYKWFYADDVNQPDSTKIIV